jgi:hypothetical protein
MPSDEEELQEVLGKAAGERNEFGALNPPLPHERERLALVPCMSHGQDLSCTCSATIDVELDLYHIGVLYPGLLARALHDYMANHHSDILAKMQEEGVGL